jgi:hypothetical protein
MFSMYTELIGDEVCVVLQHGDGEGKIRLAFDRGWAGRVALGMLEFALGLTPEPTNNEEEVTNG